MIIPVYNVKTYLCEAVDSVINQTYRNLEIIIVDDGSTDGSGEICDEYKTDPRVTVIHQKNLGLSGARNTGINMATGYIISFLDSDDAFHPEMIQRTVKTILDYDADIVVCKHKETYTNGRMKLPEIKHNPKVNVLDGQSALRALARGIIEHGVWDKIYKSELRKKIRFPQGQVYEDVDTTYQVLNLANRVCVLNESLIAYRQRKNSISYRLSLNSIKDYNIAYTHLADFVSRNTSSVFSVKDELKVRRDLLSALLGLYVCRRDNETEKAVRNAAKAVEVKKCGVRVRIEYWMFYRCPWLLSIIYPTFRWLKRNLRSRG